jgi:hypothetical protein
MTRQAPVEVARESNRGKLVVAGALLIVAGALLVYHFAFHESEDPGAEVRELNDQIRKAMGPPELVEVPPQEPIVKPTRRPTAANPGHQP